MILVFITCMYNADDHDIQVNFQEQNIQYHVYDVEKFKCIPPPAPVLLKLILVLHTLQTDMAF